MMSEEKKNNNDVLGADFNKINVRLIIKGIIKLDTQMHIGIGGDDIRFSPESGILRTSLNLPEMEFIPYIPCSTIKGNLRSITEAIAKAFANKKNDNEYICEGYPEEYCRIEGENEEGVVPCAVCRIFGGSDLASHIIFSDALPNKETLEMIHTSLKPGIAIDRERQVSKDRSLFFIETLHPGAEFEFMMIINNISKENKPKEYKLLRTLFKMIKLGLVTFGGKKSIGMGKFIFKNAELKELKNKNDFLFPEEVESVKLDTFFEI